jgi:glycosyltransferase involved in cell wall biosynthesis
MIKLAVLSPVAWRTPPRHYGPWEQVASNIAEGAVAMGLDVTLYATGDSQTSGKLESICAMGYEEDQNSEPKVSECMHISCLMERADEYDLIHNNFDFLPLTYSRLIKTPMVTTIHGFSSPLIIPVYQRYNDRVHYVSISMADRSPLLMYIANVYNGLKKEDFTLSESHNDYLLFFGRIHYDKGTYEAIEIAKGSGRRLIIAGIIQDTQYFKQFVEPHIDGEQVIYVGSAGPEKRNELLGGAFALLHPVNFDEPFGLSVAESMFCGTPVIAFNRGSMPELIMHEKSGFLVGSVAEAVESVKNIPLIDRAWCREWAEENFSLEKMAKDYLEVYKEILRI